jgi:histidine triad (HIT) family protein
MDCIFCKIAAGEIPSKKIYEDDHVLAFHDIQPIAPVHVLVIPKKHIPNLMEIGEDDADTLLKVHQGIQQVARATGLTDKGFRVVSNTGPDAQQSVFHIHYHVLGGRPMNWEV